MPLERVSLEARLRELEDRLDNIEAQEKMGLTGQVSGSYNLYEEIDDVESDETIRMTFGLYDAVDEDGAPVPGQEFGLNVRSDTGTDILEINDTGLVVPGQPCAMIKYEVPTITVAAWTTIWAGSNFTTLYDAVRFSMFYTNSSGSTFFRLRNNVGTPVTSDSTAALSGSGTVDFRWKHQQDIGTGPGPIIELQAFKSGGTGTCSMFPPYIAHFVGSEKIGATTGGLP